MASQKFWFPHRYDSAAASVQMMRTDVASLRAAEFLDGRTPFWHGTPEWVPLDEAERRITAPVAPSRTIWHMSFCGSTLLATALDCASGRLCLKEPQLLVDLADAVVTSVIDTGGAARLAQLLHRGWDRGQAGSAKPSNWACSLLAEPQPASSFRLFVTIERRPFLRAVLRGGRDRLAFTARAASHFATRFAAGEHLLRNAIDGAPTPVGQAMTLAALAHRLQQALFARAGADGIVMVTLQEIEADLASALRKAAAALDLPLDTQALARAVGSLRNRHAKAAGQLYSPDRRNAADAAIEAAHKRDLDRAENWVEALDPSALMIQPIQSVPVAPAIG